MPDLFKVLAADRSEGDIREAVEEIVKKVTETDDPKAANDKIETDILLRAKLERDLDALKVKAIEEQEQAEREQREIDIAFLEIEKAAREQQHKQQLDDLSIELESVNKARSWLMQAIKSEKWWISAINPILTLIITIGFVATLYFILQADIILENREIANSGVFYAAVGVLATGFSTVVGFYFGSSSGSKFKDDILLNTSPAPDIKTSASTAGGSKSSEAPNSPTSRVVRPEATAAKATPPDPGGRFGLFRQKAPAIINSLMGDLGLTLEQACGILGNIGHECAGFRKLQEVKPIVPGSRGGWGWCQWTGPRRRAFELWCTENGFSNLSADDANYGFLKHELEQAERRALLHLRSATSLRDATESFMEKFERPGVKHLDSRINWAKEALAAFRSITN